MGIDPEMPAEIGKLDSKAAELLGVKGTTLLVVRPDGYIGLRADRDHLRALEMYGVTVRSGRAAAAND